MVWADQTGWTWPVSGRLGGLWQLLQRQADHSIVESYGHRKNADTLPPLDRFVCKPAGGRGVRVSVSARQSQENWYVSVRGVFYTTSDSRWPVQGHFQPCYTRGAVVFVCHKAGYLVLEGLLMVPYSSWRCTAHCIFNHVTEKSFL